MTDDTSNTPAIAPGSLTPEQIEKAMLDAGLITPAASGTGFNRVRVDGQRFIFGDAQTPDYTFDSPSDGSAAFNCLFVSTEDAYHARWMDETLAAAVGRPHMAGKFCKTHDAIPAQGGHHAEDGTECATCPVYYRLPKDSPVPLDGNGIAKKCGDMMDIEFWLINDDGQIEDDRIWTLSMSATGGIEWRGSFSNRAKGYVSEINFRRQLAILAAQRKPDQIALAVVEADAALADRGVLASARIVRAESGGNRFSVPSFTPIDIVAAEAKPALPTTEPEAGSFEAEVADVTAEADEKLPF